MIVPRVVVSEMFDGMSIHGSAPTGLTTQTYSATFTAVSPTPPPYTFTITGTLPPSIDPTKTSDSITFSSNNLTTAGIYTVTLTARNSDRVRASITITFVIIASEPDTALIDEYGDFLVDESGNYLVYA